MKRGLTSRSSRYALTACLGTLLTAAPSLALSGQWTLWADAGNGYSAGTYPCLALSPATHELYVSYQFNAALTPVGSLGKVWRTDLNDPTHAFTLLPQTGFVLPPPGGSNPQNNAFTMTVNAAGEPIVGSISPGTTNLADKIFRFDKATQKWVVPTLVSGPGGGLAQMPNAAMYNLIATPDGTIYGGGQFANVFKSTDGGHTFSVIDETALLKQTDPNYFPTVANGQDYAGAVYGINYDKSSGRLYIGTESAGGIYSPDGGNTWHPVDASYTNPNSPLARLTNSGNDAGVGITRDGKVVYEGRHGYGALPADDGISLWYVDPVAQTLQSAQGIPANLFNGQAVDQIITTDSGQMFFHSNAPTVNSDGTPGLGGIYTSSDGLHWSQFNAGINDVVKLPDNSYYDLNGHGSSGSFAVLGDQVFFETQDGKIWTYTVPEPTAAALLGVATVLLMVRNRPEANA